MKILNEIEQTIARIEADIAHIVALRAEHLKTESAHILSEVDNKINGLKAWLEDIKQAIYKEDIAVIARSEATRQSSKSAVGAV